MRINAHSHVMPYPNEIPAFMKDHKIFWIDDDRSFMRQGDWSRPITDPSFFVHEKIEWMEATAIDQCVVLNLSQLYCNGYERALAKDVIAFQNDYNHHLQTSYQGKFIGGFVIQPRFIDDALSEIDRCVRLGMYVLCLPSHYINDVGKWVSVASHECKPIFDLANQHRLAIEIHPYDAEQIIQLEDKYWRFHLIWMCAMTADTHHLYTLNGFAELYPHIRTCFAHGNQYGQVNLGRRVQGYKGRPDLFPNTIDPALSVGHPRIFFDSLVHDVLSFELMVKRSGASQIIAGLDDPYPLGEMQSVPTSYPGKVIDEAVEHHVIDSIQKEEMWHANVLRWLGKQETEITHD